MALFDFFKKKKQKEEGEKKKEEKQEEKKETKSGALAKASNFASRVLLTPHQAEKSTFLSEKGVYVFEVAKRANKVMIKQAIKEKYGVIPRKIRIINLPSKTISFRGRKGIKSGFKKALVYLKPGDKIEMS